MMNNIWIRGLLAIAIYVPYLLGMYTYLSWWETGQVLNNEYLDYDTGRIFGKINGILLIATVAFIVWDDETPRKWWLIALFGLPIYATSLAWFGI